MQVKDAGALSNRPRFEQAPVYDRMPGRTRLAIIVGLAVAGWAIVIFVAMVAISFVG